MRIDISEYLYHWVKASSDEEAMVILQKIIADRKLIGSNGFVRGNHKCVCFTETPMNLFHQHEHRYKKFGLRFKKEFIFKRGGRPAIYQPSCEYEDLPAKLKWRHVTFELPSKDFTWEREWRLNTNELEIDPEEATFIVPDDLLGGCLSTTYFSEEYRTVVDAIPVNEPAYNLSPKNFRYIVL